MFSFTHHSDSVTKTTSTIHSLFTFQNSHFTTTLNKQKKVQLYKREKTETNRDSGRERHTREIETIVNLRSCHEPAKQLRTLRAATNALTTETIDVNLRQRHHR